MRPAAFVLMISTLLPAFGGSAGSLDDLSGPAKLDALIEQVVRRQREVQSLRAGFVQFKRSAMPNGPKVSAGGALSPRDSADA